MDTRNGWEELKTDDPSVWASRMQMESGIYVIKAETLMKVDIEEMLEFLRDLNRKPEFDKLFDTGHNIEEYEHDSLTVYQKYKSKLFVSARDFVIY
jgi:hypothetical protein